MKKTTIYLPDEAFTWLEQETKRTELKMADIIRRALDEYRVKRVGRRETDKLTQERKAPPLHPKAGAECDNCGSDKRYCKACRHRPGIYDERKWEARED